MYYKMSPVLVVMELSVGGVGIGAVWFIIFLLTISIIISKRSKLINQQLPPGPLRIPILSDLQWLRKSFADLEPILRNLRSKYGPIFNLYIGRRKSIFIASHNLAHKALIQNGAAFADRPTPPETTKFISSHQHIISTAPYGSLWRLLRRNLTSHILHPSLFKSYSLTRKRVMEILKNNLRIHSKSGDQPIRVVDHFQYAMFSLLVLMCFGENVDEKSIKNIEVVQRALPLSFNRFNILNVFPKLGKILFRNRWLELHELRSNQRKVLIPLIRAREANNQKILQQDEKVPIVAYVDRLLNIHLPDELGGRKLEEHEIVSLCSEFLNGGTDTTTTALQWIMANLVKHQNIQWKLLEEINSVLKSEDVNEIKEEDLQKMPYLKAVVLEGLRRHPPSHFVLPHAVTEDIYLDGYVIPKDAMVNFMVADIGWDSKIWEDPMEFRPDRFMSSNEEVIDITGNKEIKMMPFGAGRRICPGLGLALLHLEYFVANLVWEFKWTARIGDDVDLSEKQDFTMVMKNPLCAHISPRIKRETNQLVFSNLNLRRADCSCSKSCWGKICKTMNSRENRR